MSGGPFLGPAPRPAEFAAAWRQKLGDVLCQASNTDGRLSRPEAERILERSDEGFIVADNALSFFERTGQKTVRVEKLIRVLGAEVETEVAKVAGPNQRLSLIEARMLPKEIREDVLYLRGKGLPKRVQPTDFKAAVRSMVQQVLDEESAIKLSAPPWQVMGKKPIIENIPHPASNTRAIVYVADGQVYFSRAASTPTPLVGWYHGGPAPELPVS